MESITPMLSLPADTPARRTRLWSSLRTWARKVRLWDKSLESSGHTDRFATENRDLTIQNARIGAWIIIILMPLCSALDYLVYRQQFLQFLVLRLTCSLCCLPLLFSLGRQLGKQYYKAIPVLLPVIPACFISYMIYLSRDAASIYYAGLALCIVGTSFVFNWTIREISITLAIILGVYFAATLPHLNASVSVAHWGHFLNNTAFILLNCFVLVASSAYHHAIRRREFVTRCTVEEQREELRARNDELTQTLNLLRQTEAQLIQSEKIVSLDRLSAGIIHEINNPLNFAKSALFVLRKKARNLSAGEQETLSRIMQDIGEGIDRVASIVSDLRSFSHPEHHFTFIDIGDAVRKSIRMVRQQLEERTIALDVVVSAGLLARADENHLIQIIINLVQNSIAALEGRPTPQIQIAGRRNGERIELSVIDNGCGIELEHFHRVFDPFFTTKDVGEGMGMGLNICYRMMKQMGGGIDLESQPNVFTKFTLWLPFEPTNPDGSAS